MTAPVKYWVGWVTIAVGIVMLSAGTLNVADRRYDQRKDVSEVREIAEFLTHLAVNDRIVRLDGRIEVMESVPFSQRSRDEVRTLNELRLERTQLRRRLEKLEDR